MALLWLESFDYCDTFPTFSSNTNFTNILSRRYEVASTSGGGVPVDSPNGGAAAQFGGSSTDTLKTKPLRDATVDSLGILGMRMRFREFPILTTTAEWFSAGAGNDASLRLRPNKNGSFGLYNYTTIKETSPPIFAENMGWVYIEIKFRVSASVGSVEVKIDGSTVWTSGTHNLGSNISSSTYWNSVQLYPARIAEFVAIDDIYILDGTGSNNNNYLGDTLIESINPSSDGDSSTWTPSSGTNHAALVDDAQNMLAYLSETDYITGDATGEKDLFNYSNLASPGLSTASAIHGLQVTTYDRIIEAQPQDIKVLAKQNGTEGSVTKKIRQDESTGVYSTQAVFELNPDTASLWTPSQVDAAQFGVEMV